MARRSRIVLGLNSGTSADGVDAVTCEITGRGPAMRVQVLGHLYRKYEPELRQRILAAMAPAETRTEEICRLDTEIGRAFARTAAAAVKKLGLKRLDLIGSHGQTICHLPPGVGRRSKSAGRQRPRAREPAGTLQIGSPAVIAARLQTPVVAHFRQADMAVGGQGAPLTPWTDHVLFRHAKRNRIVQNIGGIANLTWLPAGGRVEEVIAFDVGPGNMVIDALVSHFTKGREQFDRHGRRAARGVVDSRLADTLMDYEFLAKPPPKSCGREQYGEQWVRRLLSRRRKRRLSPDDWIATATDSAALGIVLSYATFLRWYEDRDREIILCGGGVRNRSFMRSLEHYLELVFGEVKICTTGDYGIPPQAKEGVSFAMLAAACVDRVPANLANVTGAGRRVVLGQVCITEPGK